MKIITKPEEINYIVNLSEKDCLKISVISDLFGDCGSGPKYNPSDLITIPAGSYGTEGHKNKKPFTTTVGLWVFNRAFIEKDLFDLFGYINEHVTKKVLGKIKTKVTDAIMMDRLPLQVLKDLLKKQNKIMPFCTILCPGFSMKLLTITKKVEAEKAKLIKKYKKEIDARDEQTIVKIQDELMELAKNELKGDPALDLFDGVGLGDMGNNFKNMFVMKGLIRDPDPTKGYNVVMSSYVNGVDENEYKYLANSLAEGPYKRGVRTQIGGYWEKLILSAYQHLKINKADCGTKRTLTITLDDDNLHYYMYSNIVEGSRLIELTPDNADKYRGKTVKIRFSSLCECKDGFCEACTGGLFKRIGIKNIGCAMPQIASTVKLKAMKAFHDSQVEFATIDYMEAFGLK